MLNYFPIPIEEAVINDKLIEVVKIIGSYSKVEFPDPKLNDLKRGIKRVHKVMRKKQYVSKRQIRKILALRPSTGLFLSDDNKRVLFPNNGYYIFNTIVSIVLSNDLVLKKCNEKLFTRLQLSPKGKGYCECKDNFLPDTISLLRANSHIKHIKPMIVKQYVLFSNFNKKCDKVI